MIFFSVVLIILAVVIFIIAVFSLNNKGVLLNNTYLYASKSEREKMDKKPYYKQTGIILIFVSLIFLLNAFQLLLKLNWIFYVVLIIAAVTVIYAVISSMKISKNKNKK